MNCCNNISCANSITVTATNVVLDFASVVTLTDEERFDFRICQNVPSTGLALPVLVTVNGSTIPLLNKYGNPITGVNLRTRKIYRGYYGASTPHVLVYNTPITCCDC